MCIWSALFPYFNSVAPFKALREENPSLAAWYDELALRQEFVSAVEVVFKGKVKETLNYQFKVHGLGCVLLKVPCLYREVLLSQTF